MFVTCTLADHERNDILNISCWSKLGNCQKCEEWMWIWSLCEVSFTFIVQKLYGFLLIIAHNFWRIIDMCYDVNNWYSKSNQFDALQLRNEIRSNSSVFNWFVNTWTHSSTLLKQKTFLTYKCVFFGKIFMKYVPISFLISLIVFSNIYSIHCS